jgi:LmbE family N-acetylglucosaminyl deacetylase
MGSDVLAVSPHLDDAVLSVGGQIAELTRTGCRVTVFTVFAGLTAGPYSPVASRFHEEWGLLSDPVRHRRAEDLRALNWLGAEAVHGDFLDAIYRTDPVGRWIVGAGSVPTEHVASDEAELTSRLCEAVRALIVSLEPSLLLTCASVGDHVDHIHTCDAVRAAAAATGVGLRLWTDLPYARVLARSLPEPLQARIGAHSPQPYPLSDHAWQAKLHAVGEYASQHAMFWPGVTDIDHVMHEQAATLGSAFGCAGPCEVLWAPVGGGTD